MWSAYKILVENPEEKRPLGKLVPRWKDNIRMDLRKWVWKLLTGFMYLRIGQC
jgi:hypothetical protein